MTGAGEGGAGTGAPYTLLAFLTTTCAPCQPLWERLASSPPGRGRGVALAVVTPSPALEDERAALHLTPPGVTLHMASETWFSYGVGQAGTFVLVRNRAGEAMPWEATGEVLGSAVVSDPAQLEDKVAAWLGRAAGRRDSVASGTVPPGGRLP
ncbi:MAG: hypothetical protein ACRDZX_01105 [Acidimicrobiales bacterium]